MAVPKRSIVVHCATLCYVTNANVSTASTQLCCGVMLGRQLNTCCCAVPCCVPLIPQDGQYDEIPTCGWYYSMGQRVVDSQGFVCQCESSVIWDSTFGTNTQRT
jgi:hypothetical protein